MRMTWKGLSSLEKKLGDMKKLAAAKAIVKQNTAELQKKMVKGAVFDKGYSTGQTRRSINLELKDDNMTGIVKPGTNYSPYVEYGTRKMSAQPFVRPAYNAQKEIFKQDLNKLVK
ncbi:phage protein%2C HK97 gp10 family [Chlamydia trachomatis]|nr:phage protein%2C HK97 gp10 family [Chlamydia trachomatis]